MPPTPNAIDLTTLANVKTWAGVTGVTLDQEIQDCITSFSAYVLKQAARGPADGSIPVYSPFVTPVGYDELYDGNGNDYLQLRNWPITLVNFVNANGITVPASTGITVPGYVIDQPKKALVLRAGGTVWPQRQMYGRGGGFGGYGRLGWPLGTQNIEVSYDAGFVGVPFDLEMMARKVTARNYKGTQWIGQRSQAMAAGAGTVSFNDWILDQIDKDTMQFYKARAA